MSDEAWIVSRQQDTVLGSVDKVLDLETWRPEFSTQEPVLTKQDKTIIVVVSSSNPIARDAETGGPLKLTGHTV